MSRPQNHSPLFAFGVLALAVAALAAAAPPPRTATAFVPGRSFGIGEQQVYTIEQNTKLTVRFRRPDGSIDVKNLESTTRRSVAFTVEGLSSAGNPVLAVATAVAIASPAAGAAATPSASPKAVPSASPPPSPDVRSDGSVNVDGGLADLSPLAGVLAGAAPDKLEPSMTWRSEASVNLPLASLALHMSNTANAPSADGPPNVIGVTSTGSADVSGSTKISGYGSTTLRGAGAAVIQAFVDKERGVLLGMSLTVGSRGNAASARGDHGGYDLNAQYTVKLVRYVAGVSPASPNAQPTLNTLTRFASPDSAIFSGGGNPSPLAHPGPTNTFFLSSPQPAPSETTTPAPSESLPPIPIPQSSDAPMASPPAPPSPSPT
ncbi:MAG TPA: hypothetical protein VN934_00450 [Candidatus Tumulicola sp.]|nr:hypothetical protein [Candidatus Tumulicola sp.]